jgi:UDP-galactopyranose mutase
VIRRILDHPAIDVQLEQRFEPDSLPELAGRYHHVFYTGPIDAFCGHRLGRLGYRTVTFERVDTEVEDYQGNAVINYPDLEVPYTRIHEHKHFTPWEQLPKTVAFREYSKETEAGDIPYYPKRLAADQRLLLRYRELASACPHQVSFLGRLATYRYMDMETVIAEALDFAQLTAKALANNSRPPVFPNHEDS